MKLLHPQIMLVGSGNSGNGPASRSKPFTAAEILSKVKGAEYASRTAGLFGSKTCAPALTAMSESKTETAMTRSHTRGESLRNLVRTNGFLPPDASFSRESVCAARSVPAGRDRAVTAVWCEPADTPERRGRDRRVRPRERRMQTARPPTTFQRCGHRPTPRDRRSP